MIRVEVEIVMTMDMLTARAVKAAIQVATITNHRGQNLSSDAIQRVKEVADKMYNNGVVIQPDDVVN